MACGCQGATFQTPSERMASRTAAREQRSAQRAERRAAVETNTRAKTYRWTGPEGRPSQ